jgi:hypothetical protein
MSWALVMVVFGNMSFTRSSHVPPKPVVETAILGLEENKGLSARDVAVNSLDPFKPRIAVGESRANTNDSEKNRLTFVDSFCIFMDITR